ncbi:hypothetical protein BD770DRAFT_411286 [Pilaira anomala]|nr:hypothetical protein BD770DRAFT_411286 [Pilaira anomala]
MTVTLLTKTLVIIGCARLWLLTGLSEVSEEITKQIHKSIEVVNKNFSNYHLIPEHQYSAHRDVRNRVHEMVQKVFASIWASIGLTGSSELFNPENWEANLLNSEFLFTHLENIGMENIVIPDEPNRCNFYDLITKTNCRIGVDLRLIYERNEIILEYFNHSLTKDGIIESYIKLYDCIRIKNSVTKEFNGTDNFEESESSLWKKMATEGPFVPEKNISKTFRN